MSDPAAPLELYRAFIAAAAVPFEGHPWLSPPSAAESRLLARLPLPRVLVAGCGLGREVPPLLALGARVTAVDREPAMIGALASRLRHPSLEARVADIAALPSLYGAGAFDGAVCLGLVSAGLLLPGVDTGACLRALFGLLRPGGALLMDFLLAETSGRLERFEYPLAGRRVSGCSYSPSRQQAREALEAAGFTVEWVALTHPPAEPREAAFCSKSASAGRSADTG